jgi:hypothetical protein
MTPDRCDRCGLMVLIFSTYFGWSAATRDIWRRTMYKMVQSFGEPSISQ